MVPCKSTAEEVSFEWSHHRVLAADLKVKTTLHVTITDSGSEKVKRRMCTFNLMSSFTVLFMSRSINAANGG